MKTKRNIQVAWRRRAAGTTLTIEPKQPVYIHLLAVAGWLSAIGVVILLGMFLDVYIEHFILKVLYLPPHYRQFMATISVSQLHFESVVALCCGLVCAVPMAVFAGLRFFEPIVPVYTNIFAKQMAMVSGVLAACGLFAAYHFGLSGQLAVLSAHLAAQKASPEQVIHDYIVFQAIYLMVSAVAFQLPLVVYVINQGHFLSPRQLVRGERWAVAGGLLVGLVLAPTSLSSAALAIILSVVGLYQAAFLLVLLRNQAWRGVTEPQIISSLVAADVAGQLRRANRLETAFVMAIDDIVSVPPVGEPPETPEPAAPVHAPAPSPAARPAGHQQTVMGIRRRLY